MVAAFQVTRAAVGIESLQEAARAAGFAMAAPDDEADGSAVPEIPRAESRALVPVPFVVAKPSAVNVDALTRISSWVRGHMPTFGGRAPA